MIAETKTLILFVALFKFIKINNPPNTYEKNTFLPILLFSFFLFISESVFAGAKPPGYKIETIKWGTQKYKFTLIKKRKKVELGSAILRTELKDDLSFYPTST